MALCIRKEYYEKLVPKEPEQDFYDCWKHIVSEMNKNDIEDDEELFDDNLNLWDEWNDIDI